MTKKEQASYDAGYRAGYDQRESMAELRHKDLRPFYIRGYFDGAEDKAIKQLKAQGCVLEEKNGNRPEGDSEVH